MKHDKPDNFLLYRPDERAERRYRSLMLFHSAWE
jgi:hypothetical protein